MVYELADTAKVTALFEGWPETTGALHFMPEKLIRNLSGISLMVLLL